MRKPSTLLASAVLLAGCASAGGHAPTSASGPGARPTASEITALATLIRLEDRREWDEAALQNLAASPSPLVRAHAALAAGRIGDKHATPLLTRMLADGDTTVAADAAFALGL
ncbi:MAG TPA: HEAT repeat domain-containing protein, partial [Longimicrobiaceae bacterium]|nr:HEAT repeat domain-containing protein [Longimicrobiaceae bacterium]